MGNPSHSEASGNDRNPADIPKSGGKSLARRVSFLVSKALREREKGKRTEEKAKERQEINNKQDIINIFMKLTNDLYDDGMNSFKIEFAKQKKEDNSNAILDDLQYINIIKELINNVKNDYTNKIRYFIDFSNKVGYEKFIKISELPRNKNTRLTDNILNILKENNL